VNTASAASFQLVQLIHDVTTATINNLRTDDNYYCFRLGAFDPCNNITVYSNIICSTNFELALQSNLNNLTWTSSTLGVTNFTVNRDGAFLGSTGALSFPDNNVVCETNYCYQVLTNYANGSQSISLEKCGTAFSNDVPTAIENVTAVVGSGTVELTWVQDPTFQAAEYRVFRKSGNGNLSLQGTTASVQYNDAEYSTDESYCYRIDYTDVCDNNSLPGIEVCPIRLSASLGSDNAIKLTWSEYTGWVNGVDFYEIEKYDADDVLLQTFTPGTDLELTDDTDDPSNQVYRYVVIATANDLGVGEAISNKITVTKKPNLFYPTAFTPDQQGPSDNEIFKVFGQYIVKFEMKIFNRWGLGVVSGKGPRVSQGVRCRRRHRRR
jgi:hypothetical protein